MLRTQVNLREDQYQSLRIQAEQEGESISEVVRKLLDSSMKQKGKDASASLLLEMSQKASRSGIKNLSTSYKQILYGGK